MPKVNDIFPSKSLNAEDLEGRDWPLRIHAWRIVEFNDGGNREQKLELSFIETDRVLVVNKTNASEIAKGLGDEVENWPGGRIVIYPTKTEFKGKQVDCIRVKAATRLTPSDESAGGL